MQDQNEIDFVVAVCRIADALERLGDIMESNGSPRESVAPEPEPEVAEAPAPAKKPRKKRATKKTPKAQTEIETDGISLEELSELAQDYSKERGKAGADRIRKFLSKLDMKKLAELSPEDRETLATNLRK